VHITRVGSIQSLSGDKGSRTEENIMNVVSLSETTGEISTPSNSTEVLSIDERIRKNQISEPNNPDESSSREEIYELVNFRWFSDEISKTPDDEENQW
ncbi:hypothetical protein RCN48_19510, partial [Escherichia marmotae]|nr:hypothetical protein [Escherichia marmotae]